jgi:hypothetical protein
MTLASTRHPVARALHQSYRAPQVLVTRPHGLYLNLVVRRVLVTRLHRLYLNLVVRRGTHLLVAPALHQLRRTPRLLVSRCEYSSLRSSGSTSTTPCATTNRLPIATALPQLRRASGCLGSSRGSSSTTMSTLSIRLPRLLAWLVVDYYAYVAHPGASAPRAARHRLLRLCRAPGCLGSSHGSSSTTSPTPRI